MQKKSYLNFSIASFFSFCVWIDENPRIYFKVFVGQKNHEPVRLVSFYAMIFVIGLDLSSDCSFTMRETVIPLSSLFWPLRPWEKSWSSQSTGRCIYPAKTFCSRLSTKNNKSIIQSYISGLGVPLIDHIGFTNDCFVFIRILLLQNLFLFGCIILSNYVWFIVSKIKGQLLQTARNYMQQYETFEIGGPLKRRPSKVDQSFQTDTGIVKFLNKATGQKDHDKDLLINDLIFLIPSEFQSHSFIFACCFTRQRSTSRIA